VTAKLVAFIQVRDANCITNGLFCFVSLREWVALPLVRVVLLTVHILEYTHLNNDLHYVKLASQSGVDISNLFRRQLSYTPHSWWLCVELMLRICTHNTHSQHFFGNLWRKKNDRRFLFPVVFLSDYPPFRYFIVHRSNQISSLDFQFLEFILYCSLNCDRVAQEWRRDNDLYTCRWWLDCYGLFLIFS
jgi:hypothetical protein